LEFKTIIGLIAASLTTIAFLPQVIKAYKYKQTKDISLVMYIIFVLGIISWLAYGILINDLPIIMANTISLILTSTILILKLIYK